MKKPIKTVLLIEDNAGDARLLREMFNEQSLRGIALTHVDSMRGAEIHLAKNTVDIILLDLGLPDVQGLQAVRRARAMSPSTPLVVLTGLDDQTLAARALREGAQDYLIKGEIEPRGFSRALHHAIERKIMEGRYSSLLEAAPDAMVVVDQAGEIVLLNLQAEKQFGYSRDELVGQKVTNIIPHGFAERLIADDLRSAEDALAQQIGTGIELIALRKDKSEFPIELMLSPLASVDGTLVTAAIRNISVRKAAEERLTKMEARYRGLLEAAPDAMVVVDQADEIVLLNLQAEKQFGYSRDELVGQKVTNIIPRGFAERLIADGLRSDEEALAQQIGTGIELTAVRKDASEFPIELMLSPLESADGILVTAAIRNISVRKAAEEHLTKMEGRYRGLLEAAPDAMVVVNQAGEIVLLNLQAEKKFGYSRDELVGQKVTNIIPRGFAERLIADGLRSDEEALAQQIGTGIELTAVRKDASEFPIELMLSPLESADGTLVTAAIRDISVRKSAESLQAKTEARYRGLLEAAPDAMVVVNQAGEIVLLNLQAEKQFGYSRDELVGQKVTNIIPQGFAERLIADGLRSAEEALAQNIGTGIELTALRKNGSEFPIELMLSPLESADGILITAAIRDIATRRQLEHQLRQVQKMEAVGQLTGGVAHDFNNLLTVITCTIECIAEAVADNPELAAMAKSIDQAAERGAQLTQRMLAFARKQPLQSRDLDLNEIANRMVGMLGRMLSEDIDLKTNLEADLWTATADGNQVEDAILNLAINARDAMPKGGKLVIETENMHLDKHYAAQNAEVVPGDYVSIAVTDSGSGMSADVMERAFEPFYTTKEVGRGTGLGLSMVYGFAKQSRGHVKIYSEVGRGTTAKLYLPRATPASAIRTMAKAVVPERRAGNETILVVEDDALVRGIVLTMLRGLGYRVRESADAGEALEILRQGDPIDLLFTDIVMPGGMSGWELVEAARLERPTLKALFTSGYSDRILKERARGSADIRLLAKPYRSRSLGEAIREVLDQEEADLLPIARQA